jgi:hypothetical protein
MIRELFDIKLVSHNTVYFTWYSTQEPDESAECEWDGEVNIAVDVARSKKYDEIVITWSADALSPEGIRLAGICCLTTFRTVKLFREVCSTELLAWLIRRSSSHTSKIFKVHTEGTPLAEAAELYLPDEILIPFCKKIREDNYLSLFLPDIKMQRKLKRRYARLKKEAPNLKNADQTDHVKVGKVLEMKRIELELSRLGENTQNQKLYHVLSMMKRYEEAARTNCDTPVAKEYYQSIKPAIQRYIDSCKDEIAWS